MNTFVTEVFTTLKVFTNNKKLIKLKDLEEKEIVKVPITIEMVKTFFESSSQEDLDIFIRHFKMVSVVNFTDDPKYEFIPKYLNFLKFTKYKHPIRFYCNPKLFNQFKEEYFQNSLVNVLTEINSESGVNFFRDLTYEVPLYITKINNIPDDCIFTFDIGTHKRKGGNVYYLSDYNKIWIVDPTQALMIQFNSFSHRIKNTK